MQHLTDQEYRIAQLIARGKTRQVIEAKLVVAPNTLRVHLSNLCKKMELSTPNAFHVKRLLQSYTHAPQSPARPLALSRSERDVITRRIAGETFFQIAQARGSALSTCLNLSSTTCRKLGIRKSTNPATLAKALATFEGQPQAPLINPMDDPAFQ